MTAVGKLPAAHVPSTSDVTSELCGSYYLAQVSAECFHLRHNLFLLHQLIALEI
jgi:hypothetical protein